MLHQILSFILGSAADFFSAACLLRCYMDYLRIRMSARYSNPLGPFVLALTNWLVLPLRRVLPLIGRFDGASLAAAVLAQMVYFFVLWLLSAAATSWVLLPVLALFGLLHLLLALLSVGIIVYAVLSWLPIDSALVGVIGQMVHPLLAPIRRILPLIGGLDLSPLLALLALQVLRTLLEHWQATAMLALA